ncbi:anti-CBASS protein Acb1 family protein [Mangrovibacter phragmitis]|uniref:anti-CBASS protein Acb1 family protein n=1 Tax=Mangrovibacter phragmitis TaxID=1691903 RepID=UPI00336AB4EE
MADISLSNNISSELMDILAADEIQPGSDVGYKICKLLWMYHPLGGKLVEKPISMALCKPRTYNVETDPDERVVSQFEEVWNRLGINNKIRDLFFLSRCYGAASIGIGTHSVASDDVLPTFGLTEDDIFINVWDPLNTAGSMVTSQDPNSPDFQRANQQLKIANRNWHPSRTLKQFNGTPIYLEFQPSSFGFTGRSVFQRALYPLKSYIQTMTASNLVSQKAGVIVAKITQNGSVMNGLMAVATGRKRDIIKEASNGGVISIGPQDDIESLNLQNLDKALATARDNIIADIAAGSDVPALLIKEEAFTQGFGEGTEDSKAISQYIDSKRQEIEPVMAFFENVIQYIAWSEDFYKSLKNDYPDIITEDYKTTFYRWRREFRATWQELVEESPDKRRESDSKVIQQAASLYTALAAKLDPENMATAAEWLASIVNGTETYGDTPLLIDAEALANYVPPPPEPLNGNENNQGDQA